MAGIEPKPSRLQVDITNRCNLNCKHCRWGSKGNTDLDDEVLINFVRSLLPFGLRRVVLSGGEPMLHPKFEEIINSIYEFGTEIVVLTNGMFLKNLSPEVLKKITRIQVSMEGVESDKRIRGEKHFEMALEGIKYASQYVKINVALTAMRSNLQEIPKLKEITDSLGVIFSIRHLVITDNAEKNKLEIPSIESYTKMALSQIEKGSYVADSLIKPFNRKFLEALYRRYGERWLRVLSGCLAGTDALYIDCFGDVYPCAYLVSKETKIGNIYRMDAPEIMRRMKNNPYFYYMFRKLEEPCKLCRFRFICGGCRCQAGILKWGKDPRCILSNNGIVPLGTEFLNDVNELLERSGIGTVSREKFILPNYYPFGYFKNNRMVGFVDLYLYSGLRRHVGRIVKLAVDEKYRRQGVGTKLLQHVIYIGKLLNLAKLEIQVVTDNSPAINLYKKTGFRIIGKAEKDIHLNSKYYDVFYMEKLL